MAYFFAQPFHACFICIPFSHILEDIQIIIQCHKNAVNLFMQWKECLTNGQMLGQTIIYFLTICMKFFFGQMFANISCILLLCDFFLQMIQQSAVVVHFSIFFQGIIIIAGILNTTPGLHSFWFRKIIMKHVTSGQQNPYQICVNTA